MAKDIEFVFVDASKSGVQPSPLTAYWKGVYDGMKDDPECRARYGAETSGAALWLAHCQKLDTLLAGMRLRAETLWNAPERPGQQPIGFGTLKSVELHQMADTLEKIMFETLALEVAGE